MAESNRLQAVIILDTFDNEFCPITDDLPLALIPLVHRPLLEYTLESLHFAGVAEVFLFCCSHSDAIKAHLKKCKDKIWFGATKVWLMYSESCCSFGDCMRDIYAKELVRGDFILVEPGVVTNMKLQPLMELHKRFTVQDKGAVMTLIYQQVPTRETMTYPLERVILGYNDDTNKIVFYNKPSVSNDKIGIPKSVLLENPNVAFAHGIRDTHVSICSQAVLSLFADNFDFQTKDDFIKGLLMNEEIMEGSLYCHTLKGNGGGSSVNNWRMYQLLSEEIVNSCMHPIKAQIKSNNRLPNKVIIGTETIRPKTCSLKRSVVGDHVTFGDNVRVENSFIFSDSKIGSNVNISRCIIGHNCIIEDDIELMDSVIGSGVVLEKGSKIDDSLVKSSEPDDEFNKLSEKAYVIIEDKDSEDGSIDGNLSRAGKLVSRGDTIDMDKEKALYTIDYYESDDEELSYTQSPVPDDVNIFFDEVKESFTRGFEENVEWENLILEVNSSRYAYNIPLNEVNFGVVRAILLMSLEKEADQPDMKLLRKLLSYFNPLISNYIRKKSAVIDCLKAFEEVATTGNVNAKWVIFVLRWLYERDHVSEEAVLEWHGALDEANKLFTYVKPFTDWLREADEEEEDSEENS